MQLYLRFRFPLQAENFVRWSGNGTKVPLDRLYRKSGEWGVWHSDSVLVWNSDWRRYILAALVKDERGEDVLKGLVPVVEGILNPANRSS